MRQRRTATGEHGPLGVDALIVGVHEGKSLRYVAKVKSGFVPKTREEVGCELRKLHQAACSFFNLLEPKGGRWGEALTAEKMKECQWVKPRLVAQVAFVDWTEALHLRHCSFVAMRGDKRAADVVRET